MVMYKRKPVRLLPPTLVRNDDAEVWHIGKTGEVFTSYESYLNRLEFYNQRKFICQITGHSGCTFFEALESELAGAKEVEQAFPEPLKGPVLRAIQFNTYSRLDAVVDMVYDEFKCDYYPMEAVIVQSSTGTRQRGVIRDKSTKPSFNKLNGTQPRAVSTYFVNLEDRPQEEECVEEVQLSRDRKAFNKSVIRSFIKKSVTREAWNGAPWLVKHNYAAQYHIDTRVPPELCHDNVIQKRSKNLQARKSDPNGSSVGLMSGPVRLPELKPAMKGVKTAKSLSPTESPGLSEFFLKPRDESAAQIKSRSKSQKSLSKAQSKNDLEGRYIPGEFMHLPLPGNPFQLSMSIRNPHHPLRPYPVAEPEVSPPPPLLLPPPPPKYPIDDLLLEPRPDNVRPQLKFLDDGDVLGSSTIDHGLSRGRRIQGRTVGQLLEVWNTLNVYCEVFKLDSFTFDDFFQAMSIDVPVQLLDEVHTAILKILVNSTEGGGEVQVLLPDPQWVSQPDEIEGASGLDQDQDQDQDGQHENGGHERPPTPPPARTTRSSLARKEAERLVAETLASPSDSVDAGWAVSPGTEAYLKAHNWIDKVRERNFADGWQALVTCVLHQLMTDDRHKKTCEEVLVALLPREDQRSDAKAIQRAYMDLDINLKVQTLQILCMLTMETKAIRIYMEECSETMTQYRKDKIELQRQKKQAIDESKVLTEQRKELDPENTALREMVIETSDADAMQNGDGEGDGHDEEAASLDTPRRPRRLRPEDRPRKREEDQRRDRAVAEAASKAKASKQSKQSIKLVKDIAKKDEFIKKCEDEILVIDNDLREADCPRTRMLGRDRFWNRYYWFERNGMPYGGLPSSSTAEAGYANGRIWVQGPAKAEFEGFINLDPSRQAEYRARFGMTVPDRRRKEEGATCLKDAHQWGYLDEPEDVEDLLSWLDGRGVNEFKLRKELLIFREKIVAGMRKRRIYIDNHAIAGAVGAASQAEEKRTSSRFRPTPALEKEPSTYRCHGWVNTVALVEFGYLHSAPRPPPPQPAGVRGKKRRRRTDLEAELSPAPPRKSSRKR